MEVTGTVKKIIYNNTENGYTVAVLDTEDGELTVVGNVISPLEQSLVKLDGDFTFHKRFGEQFAFTSWEIIVPDTKSGIISYLSSGIVPGIGKKLAERIYNYFGEETYDIIKQNPRRLSEVDGIGAKKLNKLISAFEEHRELSEVIMDLKSFELSNNQIYRIYSRYGLKSRALIEDNPYRLYDEVEGIGFKTADSIAEKLGIEKTSALRVEAGIKYVMTSSVSDGHVYMPKDYLINRTEAILKIDKERIAECIERLIFKDDFYVEKCSGADRIYLSYLNREEVYVAKKVYELSNSSYETDIDFNSLIEETEKKLEIELGSDQEDAVKNSLKSGLTVITGGPGTGKTTILHGVLNIAVSMGLSVSLAAPTGRAAKRMKEATGCEATTIHRLLEYSYNSEMLIFNRDEDNPIESDLIIIDEASMIDLMLMSSLLKAIRSGTRLILIGDVDQLPSVGCGNVLSDIIKSEVCDCFRLSSIYRQTENSGIVINAHMINEGKMPNLNSETDEFYLVEANEAEEAARTIVDLVGRRLPEYYGFDPFKDIQVLSPMKKGPAGVINLNELLQERLNPKKTEKEELSKNGKKFRVGDKLMQVKNNYELEYRPFGVFAEKLEGKGIFNGDQGIINAINKEDEEICFIVDEDKSYIVESSDFDEVSLSYCITVHKSQGSEFPVVVMPVIDVPFVLASRNLLYTAVTRAKSLVVLVGNRASLKRMVENGYVQIRFTALAERIKTVGERVAMMYGNDK